MTLLLPTSQNLHSINKNINSDDKSEWMDTINQCTLYLFLCVIIEGPCSKVVVSLTPRYKGRMSESLRFDSGNHYHRELSRPRGQENTVHVRRRTISLCWASLDTLDSPDRLLRLNTWVEYRRPSPAALDIVRCSQNTWDSVPRGIWGLSRSLGADRTWGGCRRLGSDARDILTSLRKIWAARRI